MSGPSPYPASDPRSRLTHAAIGGAAGVAGVAEPAGQADLVVLGGSDALVRGQHLVVHHARRDAGAVLTRDHQPDEYVVLVPDAGTRLRIRAGADDVLVTRPSIVIVPPGDSEVRFETPGRVVRLLTVASARDLAERSENSAAYAAAKPNVAPYAAWPGPTAGHAVRVHDLDVPDDPHRFGRIWRCSTFMVNVLPEQRGPRDPHLLSPHAHDDFEQCSLALEGSFVHHLRWPWGPDRTRWRDDLHLAAPSPSALIIPPPVVHTTEATGAAGNLLVDVFCPPRADFARVPGWVLNHDDYPLPD